MKGFTLVEILVSMLIFGLLVAGIYGVLNVGSVIYREDINLVELQQEVRRAMDSMANEIRESGPSEITITDGNARITFNVAPPVYGDPWVGPISYYRDVSDANSDGITDQIIREYPAGTRKIVANNITVLNFSLSAEILEIQVAAKKDIGALELCFPSPCEDPQRNFKGTVKLRN